MTLICPYKDREWESFARSTIIRHLTKEHAKQNYNSLNDDQLKELLTPYDEKVSRKLQWDIKPL